MLAALIVVVPLAVNDVPALVAESVAPLPTVKPEVTVSEPPAMLSVSLSTRLWIVEVPL